MRPGRIGNQGKKRVGAGRLTAKNILKYINLIIEYILYICYIYIINPSFTRKAVERKII